MAATLGVALPPVAILRDGPAVALTWWTGLAVLGVLFGLPIAILKAILVGGVRRGAAPPSAALLTHRHSRRADL